MKRLSPRLARSLARPGLATLSVALLAAALPASAQYDPANVDAMASPQAQAQMRRSAQAVAESLVGRSANATDQKIISQFADVQAAFMRQMQNAVRTMPQPPQGQAPYYYDQSGDNDYPGYDGYAPQPQSGQQGLSAAQVQALAELSRTPEGRRVLQQMSQQGYYPGGGGQTGAQQPGQVLRDALLQDVLNAASNAATGPAYRIENGRRP